VELDLSGMACLEPASWSEPLGDALQAMQRLEAGALANADEQRQVGHYWLRAPELAPSQGQASAIRSAVLRCRELASQLLQGLRPRTVLHLGIGGSALGPELLAQALAPLAAGDFVAASQYRVFDNTDPEGFASQLAGVDLARSLVLVVSKSGGTLETRNAMLFVRRAFREAGVPFAPRAVAITGEGSRLDRLAVQESWAGRLPLWDWVGGRTSITGPVGLLPAALMGIDGAQLLEGAAAMDRATRAPPLDNPAALLAAAWISAQRQRPRAMVVLPYADRLRSLSRYLQQLIMESVGKRFDRRGGEIRAGLVVYGNKGSTDQHAFVQQLRDGPDDFFACFLQLMQPSAADPVLEDGHSAGDCLAGFLEGTRLALEQDGKGTLCIGVQALDAYTFGGLVALFERAVGIYGELLDLNAYHQPGVEAGKQAAAGVLDAQRALVAALGSDALGATELAARVGSQDAALCWRILRRLSACPGRGVQRLAGPTPADDRFCAGG